MLHNLFHRHLVLDKPELGCFQFCTHKIFRTTVISYAPYDGAAFHSVPKALLGPITENARTPEQVMALLRSYAVDKASA